jgi:riboflavin transporter FmnP
MSTMSTSNSTARSRTRFIAVSAILSAAAFVLQYFEFPIPLIPSFIKMDFSDLPALIGAFALGPSCGIVTEVVKNLLHSAVSQSFGIGEISNALLGSVFVGVAGLLYKRNKTKKGALIASLAGAVAMALAAYPINLFVVYPIYYNFMPKETILQAYQLILPSVTSIEQSLWIFNVPFTFCKGMIDVLITFLVYKKLSPILHGKH